MTNAPFGQIDTIRQERRGVLIPVVVGSDTFYAEQVYDVLINETQGTETELWRSVPNVRWNVSAAQLVSEYTAAKLRCDLEEILVYDGFIESLQQE